MIYMLTLLQRPGITRRQKVIRKQKHVYQSIDAIEWNFLKITLLLYSGDSWNVCGTLAVKQKGQGESITEV